MQPRACSFKPSPQAGRGLGEGDEKKALYSLFFISLYLFKKKRKFEEENYLTPLSVIASALLYLLHPCSRPQPSPPSGARA